MPCVEQLAERRGCVRYDDERHTSLHGLIDRIRYAFANDGHRAAFDGRSDIVVPIDSRALDCDEEHALVDASRVGRDARDVDVGQCALLLPII